MLAEYFEKFTAPWPTPFFLVTADGVIVDVNPAGTRMLGSGRGKLIGTKLFDLLEDPPVTVENYLKSCSVRRAATACTLNWRNSEERSVTAQCTGFLFERKEDRESSLVILYCCLTDDFNDRLNGFRAEEAVSVFHEFLGQEEISGLDQFYDDEKPAADDLNCQFALNQAVAELSRQLIGAEENLSEMAELVLAKAREFTRSRRGFVSMIDHKSGDNVVYLPGVNTINNPVIKAPEIENIISAGDTGDYLGLWGRALNSGTSFFDNAVGRGKGSEKEFLGGAAIEKMLAVPVRYSGKLMGLIALANSRRDYNEDDLFAIERLADLYALAINRYWSREKRRELEEQLIEAQKMESIRTLAGGIAHDFNNILGIILGYADMARTDVSEDSRVAGDLDHIIKAGYRARDLVKQILTFSRQRGRALVPMQPATIVKEAIKMVRSSIPATIKIHQDIDPRCAKIMADYSQIHQIFLNLCTNAYHAMEKTGGDLYVTLRNSDY
ncbi:MAG: GAF domain-containing protein, partial [Thermodesulfobacteriota bacterium]